LLSLVALATIIFDDNKEGKYMNDMSHITDTDRLVSAEQIRNLLFSYSHHLDMNEPTELIDLFVDDCEVIYAPGFGAKGKEAYAKTLEGIGTYFKATSHHVSNVVIDFKSRDAATVRSVVYAMHRYNRDRPDGIFWGQYHDEVERVGGRWLFKRRELRAAAVKDFHVKESIPIGRQG
jgi:hypothetical protein